MDAQFVATREDLYHVQMDVKHVQAVQNNHADRLIRLEKRQADDAALKSVWGPESPFPSVLSGTPQHGPVHNQQPDVFDDFVDGHGQNLLGNLQLEANGEPVRRGASRANSVRFDVSALQGSNWAQGSRSSGEFVPIRPTSGYGNPSMERSLSHKSDGRHSSTGQSVHSVHSLHSGRTSSLGLDTNFVIGGQEEASPVIVPQPPPGLFVLGPVPSIIRCWLTTNYSHNSLLYAVVCTGSQKSVIEQSLVKELSLSDQVQKNENGRNSIRLPVYLPEAVITQSISRSSSPAPQIPALTTDFEVIGATQQSIADTKKIRVCIGSDALRAHNADILLSQNLMTLYSDDRNKLSVPFARPEDENQFKTLRTINLVSERNELKPTANPFTPKEQRTKIDSSRETIAVKDPRGAEAQEQVKSSELPNDTPNGKGPDSPAIASASGANSPYQIPSTIAGVSVKETNASENEFRNEEAANEFAIPQAAAQTESSRRASSGTAWGVWRHGGISGSDSGREYDFSSGYQKVPRTGKNMKILKPSKSLGAPGSGPTRSTSSVRTGASYEPPAPQRFSGDLRRKSQPNGGSEHFQSRWETKRVISEEQRPAPKSLKTMPRSSNPVGGASAFAWMNLNPKASTTSTGD